MNEPIQETIPCIEWVIYEDISVLTRDEIWKRAVSSRSPEAIERLVELLQGVRNVPFVNYPNISVPKRAKHMASPADQDKRVLIIVTGKTLIKRKDPFDITFEEMIGLKSTKAQFKENQELFLVP